MRAISGRTDVVDPYRAGVALGEVLAPIAPEVVFLFSSIHYAVPELLEGLCDALDCDDVIIVGNSGDGIYESAGATDHGVAALGLNSDGKVRWQLERVAGVQENLQEKMRAMLARLNCDGEKPALGFIASDFRTDASEIEAVLCEQVNFPVVGGFAADDHQMQSCYLYANREVIRDALVMLAAYGALDFSIAVGNSLRPVGNPGRIDSATGTQIERIGGLSAMAFIERETGKPVLRTDRGVLCLSVNDPDSHDEKRLRSIVPDFSRNLGAIGLFGGISTGHHVQVCQAHPEELIAEVSAIAETAQLQGRTPVAALLVSCSGRKALLDGHIQHEVGALTKAFPQIPLAGFPSFGEIAPLRRGQGYTSNLFHNMTYVSLLIYK